MTPAPVSARQRLAYYFSFVVFGSVALALNLGCLLLRLLPTAPRAETYFQRLLHRHFVAWVRWLSFVGVAHVRCDDFSRLPPGLVLVANHPGLMDITYLLACVPEAVCLFKPAIRRNPVMGAAARRAGYLASDGGPELVRIAAEQVAAGRTLVIFPEGTRTVGRSVNRFKPGFVIVARRACAPIQLVRITCDTELLVKGRPWWRVPRLPAQVTVTLGPRLAPPLTRQTAAVLAEVEAWFRHGEITEPSPSASSFSVAPARPALVR